MTFDATLIQPCGDGWCVKTSVGMEGPLESADDAANYAALLNRVSAARSELACQDNECA
ncbi:MAG: hypothetical protein OEW99_10490 [Gammaproteobacteria bacterium]|nr:hypothetical protein [Gammaproteobacteria bacterium]MDH5661169.1 hypothetical protein [Gammaproteobacteria bacterium]